jgi:hypothetical protein
MRTIMLGALLLVCFAAPARAQFAVIDPANLAESITLVQQTLAQYQLWQQMAKGLSGTDRYRVPALNASPMLPRTLQPLGATPPMSEYGLGAVAAQQAALADTDARLNAALSQTARITGFAQALAQRLAWLESDVTAPGSHNMTAVLDAIALGTMVGRHQQEAAQRTADAAFDLQVAQAIQQRNDQANLLRMRQEQLAASVQPSGVDVLRTWRQF